MSMTLQYTYAMIDTTTGECLSCMTMSYEVNHEAYILVPNMSNHYVGKFYNQDDGHWYADGGFTVALPELDW